MKNKYVGLLIIGMALIFLFIIMSFNNALAAIVDEYCTHGTSCPMQTTMFTQKVISYSLVALISIVGIIVALFMKDEQTTIIKHEKNYDLNNKLTEEEKTQKLNNLDDEERKVMDIVLRKEGSVYQSEIMKETDFSKVKITRLLDKLEGKNLIERKRRGMTNVVILK